LVATGFGSFIYVWQLEDGKVLTRLTGHFGIVGHLAVRFFCTFYRPFHRDRLLKYRSVCGVQSARINGKLRLVSACNWSFEEAYCDFTIKVRFAAYRFVLFDVKSSSLMLRERFTLCLVRRCGIRGRSLCGAGRRTAAVSSASRSSTTWC
jgi:hypothetical protein